MKTKSLLLIVVLFVWAGFVHAQNLESYHWRSISEITDREKEIIEMASRQSAERVLRDKLCFAVTNNAIIVLDKGGVLHFFASGLRVEPVTSSEVPIESSATENDHKENDDEELKMLDEIFYEFTDAWSYFERSGQDASKVDAKAYELINKIEESFGSHMPTSDKKRDVLYLYLGRLAARGNHYIDRLVSILEKWTPLLASSSLFIRVLEEYMTAERSLSWEIPNQDQKIAALYKIGRLFLANPKIPLNYRTLEPMKLLAPELYQVVAKSRAVME